MRCCVRRSVFGILAAIIGTLCSVGIIGFIAKPDEVDGLSEQRHASQQRYITEHDEQRRGEIEKVRNGLRGCESDIEKIRIEIAGAEKLREEQHAGFRRDISRIDNTQDGIIRWTAEGQRLEIERNGSH